MLKEVEHSGAVVNSVPSQQKKKKDPAFKAGGLGAFLCGVHVLPVKNTL